MPRIFSEYWSGPGGRVMVLEPAWTVLALPGVKVSPNRVASPAASILSFR